MRAKFIPGEDDRIAVEFQAENDDERLLMGVWNHQMAPFSNALRVAGWTHEGAMGLCRMRAHIDASQSPEGFNRSPTEIETLKTERDVARQRVLEVTDQRERCDRRIAELEADYGYARRREATSERLRHEAVTKLQAFREKMPHQVAAEAIVLAITNDLGNQREYTHPLFEMVTRWSQLPNKTKAEIATYWIELVERTLAPKV